MLLEQQDLGLSSVGRYNLFLPSIQVKNDAGFK